MFRPPTVNHLLHSKRVVPQNVGKLQFTCSAISCEPTRATVVFRRRKDYTDRLTISLCGFTTHSLVLCFYHRVFAKDSEKIHMYPSDLGRYGR
jgi:hypothetical protein